MQGYGGAGPMGFQQQQQQAAAQAQMQRPPPQASYPPPYPQQHPQHPGIAQAMMQDNRRQSMPPAFPPHQQQQQQQGQMHQEPSHDHLQPPPQRQAMASPQPQQREQPAPGPSPQPPQQHDFASPPIPQPKPLPAHAKHNSIFTPIDDSRSLLAQHWGTSGMMEHTRSEPAITLEDGGGPRPASIDVAAMNRDKVNGLSPKPPPARAPHQSPQQPSQPQPPQRRWPAPSCLTTSTSRMCPRQLVSPTVRSYSPAAPLRSRAGDRATCTPARAPPRSSSRLTSPLRRRLEACLTGLAESSARVTPSEYTLGIIWIWRGADVLDADTSTMPSTSSSASRARERWATVLLMILLLSKPS